MRMKRRQRLQRGSSVALALATDRRDVDTWSGRQAIRGGKVFMPIGLLAGWLSNERLDLRRDRLRQTISRQRKRRRRYGRRRRRRLRTTLLLTQTTSDSPL